MVIPGAGSQREIGRRAWQNKSPGHKDWGSVQFCKYKTHSSHHEMFQALTMATPALLRLLLG
jgi:hypothetical protein